jgi:hypothetical protein
VTAHAGLVITGNVPQHCTARRESDSRGNLDSLKEFSIGLEVFDRSSDYDPNIDAIVTVEARRLRAKLKAYYENEPGRNDPVLIGPGVRAINRR